MRTTSRSFAASGGPRCSPAPTFNLRQGSADGPRGDAQDFGTLDLTLPLSEQGLKSRQRFRVQCRRPAALLRPLPKLGLAVGLVPGGPAHARHLSDGHQPYAVRPSLQPMVANDDRGDHLARFLKNLRDLTGGRTDPRPYLPGSLSGPPKGLPAPADFHRHDTFPVRRSHISSRLG